MLAESVDVLLGLELLDGWRARRQIISPGLVHVVCLIFFEGLIIPIQYKLPANCRLLSICGGFL